MPGAGSLAKCQCCCVDRLCSRGENRGTAPQLDGAVRHGSCRTAFSCRRAKSRRSYRAAVGLSKNLVAFAPAGAKKVQSFSSATCAAKKILLRLQVWNLCAGGAQIMRAADCTPLVKKEYFLTVSKNRRSYRAAALTYFCSVNWRAAAPRGAQAAAATAAAAKTRPPSPRRCPDAAAACRRRTRANSTRR